LSAFSSCETASSGQSGNWTLQGKVTVTVGDGIDFDVQLACFKLDGFNLPDDLGAQVSNRINLGHELPLAQESFTLDIDTSGISPVNNDIILVLVWEDTNGNNQYDVGEDGSQLERIGLDEVFGDVAEFVYHDVEPMDGWYYMNADLDIVKVTSDLTGADLVTSAGL
jgi:hypothetical protein